MRGLRLAFTISLLLGGLFNPIAAVAQPATEVARIGYLAPNPAAANPHLREAFLQGLYDLGYVEGRNFVINYRYAEGKFERLPALAAELVALKADVIVAGATPAALAAKQATKIIPIVFASGGDPVTDGLVTSLARPGSNVTGLTGLVPELIGKCLEHRAFSDMTKARLGALTVLTSPMLFSERRRLVDLAATNRLPTVYTLREFVDAGGLMSYGPNAADLYRRAATYVDKILKGAKPSDLPVEQPTKFELVINLKTAKAFGLTIPPSLLARADHVVEKRASAAAERSGR
jgi:putative ABC transport system substrate-binding protein